jgi:hypothetical protein
MIDAVVPELGFGRDFADLVGEKESSMPIRGPLLGDTEPSTQRLLEQ